jgi:hypothetical protein
MESDKDEETPVAVGGVEVSTECIDCGHTLRAHLNPIMHEPVDLTRPLCNGMTCSCRGFLTYDEVIRRGAGKIPIFGAPRVRPLTYNEVNAKLKEGSISVNMAREMLDLPKFEEEPTRDEVNHPSHYTDGKIEVWDYILEKKLGYLLGNVVKYVSRAGKKDPSKELQDLKKARAYLDKQIKEVEKRDANAD